MRGGGGGKVRKLSLGDREFDEKWTASVKLDERGSYFYRRAEQVSSRILWNYKSCAPCWADLLIKHKNYLFIRTVHTMSCYLTLDHNWINITDQILPWQAIRGGMGCLPSHGDKSGEEGFQKINHQHPRRRLVHRMVGFYLFLNVKMLWRYD